MTDSTAEGLTVCKRSCNALLAASRSRPKVRLAPHATVKHVEQVLDGYPRLVDLILHRALGIPPGSHEPLPKLAECFGVRKNVANGAGWG
ncbi:hypothetical protein BH23CHL4_BH23CHL4_24780 [soil metagenome]